MTRTLYDAVTPANIPASAQMVAGYVDGRYAWSASDWARFPGAVKVRIAVFASTNDGHVLDVEPGDATPAQAVGWVQRRRAAGVDPTVYCGLSTTGYSWANVRAAFQAAGVAEPHYWVAAYPGNGPNLYAGSVAHQYANPGPYDLSVVADYWPGVDVATVSNVTSITGGVLPTNLGPLTTTAPEDDMTPDQAQQLANVNAAIGRLEAIYGAADARNRAGEIDDTHDKVLEIHAGVAGLYPVLSALKGGQVDTAALADALKTSLGAAVAADLAARLAS